MKDYETIGLLLDGLTGHGVYDVDMVADQFPKYGFEYDREKDLLSFAGGSVRLGSGSKAQVERAITSDPKGGILDPNIEDDDRLVDAVSLANAVFALLAPGQKNPGTLYHGRGKSFRVTVDAIRKIEDATKDPFSN